MSIDDHDHKNQDDVNSGHDLATLIAQTDWSDMTKRLLAYARWRLSRYRWLADRDEKADDYVQESVKLLLDGTRRYSCEKALFSFLCSTIDSLASHDREKANRRGTHFSIAADDDASTLGECREESLTSGGDFEGSIIARDEFEHFLASLDPDLTEYVQLRVDESEWTAEECAKNLSTTVSHVRNMDRRLRRRRSQWNSSSII